MGCYRVINMGVPALIGVCQQSASGGGGASSYSYSGLTSTTLSYGNQVGSGSSPVVTVPGGEELSTTLRCREYLRLWPRSTGAIFYSGSNEDRRINLDIGFVADVSSLNPADLPHRWRLCHYLHHYTYNRPLCKCVISSQVKP